MKRRKRKKLLQAIENAMREGTTVLNLPYKGVTELPLEIGNLTKLEGLGLKANWLTVLPPEIGNLIKLQVLDLYDNELTKLPPEIGQLTNLKGLNFNKNQLTNLPPEIGYLTSLQVLSIGENQLTAVLPEIGKLTNLQELHLNGNPISFPPPEIVKQGTQAILSFLREQLKKQTRQWASKMLLIGEGGVGKTTLLDSLLGKTFNPQKSTTHGIDIQTLPLKHPEEDATMQLKAWDFGGQEIYHATHQFFLTKRSLFLLVWNARHGWEQGKLFYWLDTIHARAPESPTIIVATHTDERDADLPLAELQQKYPQIAGHYAVSNKSRDGIEALREAIRQTAADLPLMGEKWPAHWLEAAEAIRTDERQHITPQQMFEIMQAKGVVDMNADILATWLHELGDILFYKDDEELDDLVILKPQWVTEYISKVLESREVIDNLGIFTRDHKDALWHDLDPAMRVCCKLQEKQGRSVKIHFDKVKLKSDTPISYNPPVICNTLAMRDYFLRIMEKFDLSYRTLENRDISLVAERLARDPRSAGRERPCAALGRTEKGTDTGRPLPVVVRATC